MNINVCPCIWHWLRLCISPIVSKCPRFTQCARLLIVTPYNIFLIILDLENVCCHIHCCPHSVAVRIPEFVQTRQRPRYSYICMIHSHISLNEVVESDWHNLVDKRSRPYFHGWLAVKFYLLIPCYVMLTAYNLLWKSAKVDQTSWKQDNDYGLWKYPVQLKSY